MPGIGNYKSGDCALSFSFKLLAYAPVEPPVGIHALMALFFINGFKVLRPEPEALILGIDDGLLP